MGKLSDWSKFAKEDHGPNQGNATTIHHEPDGMSTTLPTQTTLSSNLSKEKTTRLCSLSKPEEAGTNEKQLTSSSSSFTHGQEVELDTRGDTPERVVDVVSPLRMESKSSCNQKNETPADSVQKAAPDKPESKESSMCHDQMAYKKNSKPRGASIVPHTSTLSAPLHRPAAVSYPLSVSFPF